VTRPHAALVTRRHLLAEVVAALVLFAMLTALAACSQGPGSGDPAQGPDDTTSPTFREWSLTIGDATRVCEPFDLGEARELVGTKGEVLGAAWVGSDEVYPTHTPDVGEPRRFVAINVDHALVLLDGPVDGHSFYANDVFAEEMTGASRSDWGPGGMESLVASVCAGGFGDFDLDEWYESISADFGPEDDYFGEIPEELRLGPDDHYLDRAWGYCHAYATEDEVRRSFESIGRTYEGSFAQRAFREFCSHLEPRAETPDGVPTFQSDDANVSLETGLIPAEHGRLTAQATAPDVTLSADRTSTGGRMVVRVRRDRQPALPPDHASLAFERPIEQAEGPMLLSVGPPEGWVPSPDPLESAEDPDAALLNAWHQAAFQSRISDGFGANGNATLDFTCEGDTCTAEVVWRAELLDPEAESTLDWKVTLSGQYVDYPDPTGVPPGTSVELVIESAEDTPRSRFLDASPVTSEGDVPSGGDARFVLVSFAEEDRDGVVRIVGTDTSDEDRRFLVIHEPSESAGRERLVGRGVAEVPLSEAACDGRLCTLGFFVSLTPAIDGRVAVVDVRANHDPFADPVDAEITIVKPERSVFGGELSSRGPRSAPIDFSMEGTHMIAFVSATTASPTDSWSFRAGADPDPDPLNHFTWKVFLSDTDPPDPSFQRDVTIGPCAIPSCPATYRASLEERSEGTPDEIDVTWTMVFHWVDAPEAVATEP